MPLSTVTHLTISGFKYPLDNQTLSLGGFTSLRNKAIADTVEISFKNGNLLIFIEDRCCLNWLKFTLLYNAITFYKSTFL